MRKILRYSEAKCSNIPAIDACLYWVETFLACPNPHLGRTGTVCPWIPKAMEMDTIYFVAADNLPAGFDSIVDSIGPYRQAFSGLEPRDGDNSVFKALILVFPTISLEDAPKLIDGVQKRLKPDFVRSGFMIGEFHLKNMTPGLRSANFFPLRSPIPMLAIRSLVESDIVFLTRATDPPEVRQEYLNAYLSKLGNKLSKQAHETALNSLKEIDRILLESLVQSKRQV